MSRAQRAGVDAVEDAAKPLLLIDWDCGFCQGTRRWIERHSEEGAVRFVALSSEEGRAWLQRCGRSPEDRSTVLLVEPEAGGEARCSDRSTAVLRTFRHMRRPYRWLYAGIVTPRPLRDWGYKVVSKNRHRLA